MAIRNFLLKNLKEGFNEAYGCLGKPKGITLNEDKTIQSHSTNGISKKIKIPKGFQGIQLDTVSGKVRFVLSNEEAAKRNLLIIVPNNAGATETDAWKLQKRFPDVEFWSTGTTDYWRREARYTTGELIRKAIREKRRFHVFSSSLSEFA